LPSGHDRRVDAQRQGAQAGVVEEDDLAVRVGHEIGHRQDDQIAGAVVGRLGPGRRGLVRLARLRDEDPPLG
jgi:hypothetical protein